MLLGFYLFCWCYAQPFTAPLGSEVGDLPLVVSLAEKLQRVVPLLGGYS